MPEASVVAPGSGQGPLPLLESRVHTIRTRLAIWQAISDLMLGGGDPGPAPEADTLGRLRFSFGYGPESLQLVLGPHVNRELAEIAGWEFVPDHADNELLEALQSSGSLGLAATLVLFAAWLGRSAAWSLGWRESSRCPTFLIAGGVIGAGLALATTRNLTFLGPATAAGLLVAVVWILVLRRRAAPSLPEYRAVPFGVPMPMLAGAVAALFVALQFGLGGTAARTCIWIFAGVLAAAGARLTSSAAADGPPSRPAAAAERVLVAAPISSPRRCSPPACSPPSPSR